MSKSEEQDLPDIGYLFHYPRLDHPTDIYRLDIHITSEPTNKHFDVLRVRFPIKKNAEEIEQMKVAHPWNHESELGVCAGTVIMEDRKSKKAEAFTFGGQLTIKNQEKQTNCILVSSAPILEISQTVPMQQQFIKEVQILLAETQAKFPDYHRFAKFLIKVDPMDLYLACMETILMVYEHHHQKTENQYQLLTYLHSQKHRLKAADLIKKPILTIDNLFGIDLTD